MKLESITKIFGVLASISFVVVILAVAIFYTVGMSTPDITAVLIFVGMTIIFLLAAILTTLKRIAHDMEQSKKE
jgi:hypothetical protein